MKKLNYNLNWEFTDEDGSFKIENAINLPVLYFPLMNTYGMKCFVTPNLKGDICRDFHSYLTTPTVTEEIKKTNASRNFWIKADNNLPWSATGQSSFQKSELFNENIDIYSVYGKIGAFVTERQNLKLGVKVKITIFVPEEDNHVELMKIEVTNVSSKDISITPFYSIPIFGRSADNYRDHRQVTTMFQECFIENNCVKVKPKIFHDESSHVINNTNYYVKAFQNGKSTKKIWTRLNDFTGISGNLDNPKSIYFNEDPPKLKNSELHGVETIAAFKFDTIKIKPNKKSFYTVIHGISNDSNKLRKICKKYSNINNIDNSYKETLKFWKNKISKNLIKTGNIQFNNWVKWIQFQVKCRQIYGNSFLPDYGYGRGGRGWRDLWQDLLSIFLVDPKSGHDEIINCFKGIRIDGTNATIIGEKKGEFKADRNNIPRTWCDHAAWPVFVLNFYLNQTGDYEILNKEITYWKDQFVYRSKVIDTEWNSSHGNNLKTVSNKVYTSSILEHLLIQQLSSFYNVNNKNILLLEGADWNDTYDMARINGGSVCFFNFYSYNFKLLSEILNVLKSKGIKKVKILKELIILLDYLPGQYRIDYNSPNEKQKLLKKYFDSVKNKVSGIKTDIYIDDLIIDLNSKSKHILNIIRDNEILTTNTGYKFFNGHYDDNLNKIGCSIEKNLMMDLTSQVMPILCEISDKKLSKEIYRSVKKYLKDKDSPGIRLTTEFKSVDLKVGRITGFVYGYKEHGSKWIQQNIMLAYALYKLDLVDEANEIMNDVYEICNNQKKAKIFPGIPSFFNSDNKGLYCYLTGSSSWYLLTLITQIFGVRGEKGYLVIHPKLSEEYFDERGISIIKTSFSSIDFNIKYINTNIKKYHTYKIKNFTVNDKIVSKEFVKITDRKIIFTNNKIFNKNSENKIIINLD